MHTDDFRRIVLGLRDAVEGAHMGHPDFRVNGRIFASLTADGTRGMVVLTPEQQARFIGECPAAFQPESGAWGRSGCTRVNLAAVDEETLGEAVTLARQHAVDKGPSRSGARRSPRPPAAAATVRGRRPTRPR